MRGMCCPCQDKLFRPLDIEGLYFRVWPKAINPAGYELQTIEYQNKRKAIEDTFRKAFSEAWRPIIEEDRETILDYWFGELPLAMYSYHRPRPRYLLPWPCWMSCNLA